MRVLRVVASFGGLCLLGLLAGGCAVPGGAETAATLPAIPSRVVQVGGQGTEPSPATVIPRPSPTPAATRTPAAVPTSTPSPQPSPTDSPAPGLPTASPTQTPSPPLPTATKTPMPPPASATPSPPPPTATTPMPPAASATPSAISPPTATASPAPGAHRFLPAGPVRPDPSHPCGCPLAPAYIVGRIIDAAGNPLAGVRLACYNEWYRYPVVVSKASGEYDFAITQAETTWYVLVLNQVDEPLSPEVPVAFDPQECCRYLLDWRRVD